MKSKPAPLYDDAPKKRAREWLLSTGVGRIKAQAIAPKDLRAAILVDGMSPQSHDLDELLVLGVKKENIWAISRKWDAEVRSKIYAGANTVESYVHHFFSEPSAPCFDLVYLDFCKPLCSEGDLSDFDTEFHFRSLFNIFLYDKLNPYSVLATNFNVNAYFNNPLYREFLLAYVQPDFGSKNGTGLMSARVMSDGWMSFSDKVFSEAKDPRRDPTHKEQQIRVLMAFMQGFLSDIGEVYVPAFRHRNLADLGVISELDKPYIQEGKPVESGSHIMTCRETCQGRLAQSIRLIEESPLGIRKHILEILGGIDHLWSFAYMTHLTQFDLRIKMLHSIHSRGATGLPYDSGRSLMLPVIWDVERLEEVGSDPIWGWGAVRPYRELREARSYEVPGAPSSQ